MMNTPIYAKASIQISKPIEEVFDGIVTPDKLNKFFVEKSTAPMREGSTAEWKFPEFDDFFPVHFKKITPYEYISFDWSEGKANMLVEISLEKSSPTTTVVHIKEGKFNADEEGIKYVIGQTEGWANFLACLKAYLEYNINLRKGAFDFMKTI